MGSNPIGHPKKGSRKASFFVHYAERTHGFVIDEVAEPKAKTPIGHPKKGSRKASFFCALCGENRVTDQCNNTLFCHPLSYDKLLFSRIFKLLLSNPEVITIECLISWNLSRIFKIIVKHVFEEVCISKEHTMS